MRLGPAALALQDLHQNLLLVQRVGHHGLGGPEDVAVARVDSQ